MTISLENITCIWYPSGGFGHFINAIFTQYVSGYAKSNASINFAADGDSHAFPLILSKYAKNQQDYRLPDDLDPDQKYPLLIDNGIHDENESFFKTFQGAKIVKICYSDRTWPIVARTMISKAMKVDLSSQLTVDRPHWDVEENWSVREKYFLYLRDHDFRHGWKPNRGCDTLWIDDLLSYPAMAQTMSKYGRCGDFSQDWGRWRSRNHVYIDPVEKASSVLHDTRSGNDKEIGHVDTWGQAVINYYIWLEYGVEVPANDYSDWFTTTGQISKMLVNHGAVI